MNRLLIPFLVLALAVWPCAAHAQPRVTKVPVNTAADEDEPHTSSNGTMLFYTSSSNGKSEVFCSTRAEKTKPWSAGKLFEDLASKANVRSVFLTPDGQLPQRLYYATDRDALKKDEKGDNYDLYFVTKQTPKADFTFEQGLPFCTKDDELHPWLTHDGTSLYFSRKTKDGWRVFVATRPKDGGQFGEPVLLKELEPGFHHATLTKDGNTMYLQGPLPKDRWGLFRSTRAKDSWGKPEPLDDLNSLDAPTGDRSPALTRDGVHLYFASDRPGGKGGLDLYFVRVADLKRK
jgi:hypothetical protein